MKNSFFKFLKYNNAVPITISLVLLGAGSAFAATDPQAIYSQQQTVLAPDNTYIATVDLDMYTPQIQITGVNQDANNYSVAYTLTTIDIKDSVWQDVTKEEMLTVSKQDLGGADLGTYATKQFKNIIANELAYLGQVQQKARANTTQETVATSYGGLVGKMLTDSTQTLPGYVPVVQAPAPSLAIMSSVPQIQPTPTPTATSAVVPTPAPAASTPTPLPTSTSSATTTPDPTQNAATSVQTPAAPDTTATPAPAPAPDSSTVSASATQ